jgi:flagellar basal-body rod modification protein FlgD
MATAPVVSRPQESLLTALNGTREQTASARSANAQDRFLVLLTTQLRNQDPLNPLDNAQVTSQIAQISTVDGIERLNETLKALMTNSNEAQSLQAAALVGHGVLVPGAGMLLDEGVALGGVELDAPADAVAVTIKDANGLVVRTLQLGSLEAGSHALRWDGLTDAGAQAKDGSYSVSVAASRGTDAVSAATLQLGVVGSVVRGSDGVTLSLGSLGDVKLADVRQIL